MTTRARGICTLALYLFAVTVTGCSRPPAALARATWSPAAAANYLDARAVWWVNWPHAMRDQGTFCVSCHTSIPYVIVQPVLRAALSQPVASQDELALIEDVRRRVRLWKTIQPYYSDEGYDRKGEESRGSEAVLNAFILSSAAAQSGKMDDDARMAFDNMWSTQQRNGALAGAWSWLQFDQEPFEANDSPYYGATLAAVAVNIAPENYRSTSEIQAQLALLRQFLRKEAEHQSTTNRVMLLWASTKWSGLLSQREQEEIIHEALSRQQKDGGWRLASLSWRWRGWTAKSLLNAWIREDGTPMSGKSDGYATGLVAYVLQEAGLPRDNPQLQAALSWLRSNQQQDGRWLSESVNKRRRKASGVGLFMSDAATAYAVLALLEGDQRSQASLPESSPPYNFSSASATTNHE